jgi:hypothetical protein
MTSSLFLRPFRCESVTLALKSHPEADGDQFHQLHLVLGPPNSHSAKLRPNGVVRWRKRTSIEATTHKEFVKIARPREEGLEGLRYAIFLQTFSMYSTKRERGVKIVRAVAILNTGSYVFAEYRILKRKATHREGQT